MRCCDNPQSADYTSTASQAASIKNRDLMWKLIFLGKVSTNDSCVDILPMTANCQREHKSDCKLHG